MLDLRGAKATLAYIYDLPTSRAMQAPHEDLPTGEWYTSQGHISGSVEDTDITRMKKRDAKGFCDRISVMRLVDTGHPSTISTLRRNGVLGIVVNWHGTLGWVKYRSGTFKKGTADTATTAKFEPIYKGKGDFAYIDGENKTIAFRKGTRVSLYNMGINGVVGTQIGKTVTGVDQAGPGQGYFTGKFGNEYLLFALFGFGHAHQKQLMEVNSFNTGKQLYVTSVRRLGSAYTLQEPESGFVKAGKVYIGFSSITKGKKKGIAVHFAPVAPPKPPVVVKPSVVAKNVLFGKTNADIKKVQAALTKAGFKAFADGNYGPATKKAVEAYQKKKKLFVDGIAGPVTLKSLGFTVK